MKPFLMDTRTVGSVLPSRKAIFVTLAVSALVSVAIAIAAALFATLTEIGAARTWAMEQATTRVESPYELVATKEFNGREWKTYRHKQLNTYHLLSPNGRWIDVAHP